MFPAGVLNQPRRTPVTVCARVHRAVFQNLERATGFEPATFGLGSQHSTAELHPQRGARRLLASSRLRLAEPVKTSTRPLGYSHSWVRALSGRDYACLSTSRLIRRFNLGADSGARTRDLILGKDAFYHLTMSALRVSQSVDRFLYH